LLFPSPLRGEGEGEGVYDPIYFTLRFSPPLKGEDIRYGRD